MSDPTPNVCPNYDDMPEAVEGHCAACNAYIAAAKMATILDIALKSPEPTLANVEHLLNDGIQ